MSKSITHWKLSQRCIVFPHLEFGKLYTLEELKTIAETLKKDLEGKMTIQIFDESSYCKETNGKWNIMIGVNGKPYKGAEYLYTYMLRLDEEFGKSYGCPFQNSAYIYDIKHARLSQETAKEEFLIVEKYLMEKLGGKKINSFPC
jgi:hypothetical protein